MSALKELKKKIDVTELEWCILWRENDGFPVSAKIAAKELADLKEYGNEWQRCAQGKDDMIALLRAGAKELRADLDEAIKMVKWAVIDPDDLAVAAFLARLEAHPE